MRAYILVYWIRDEDGHYHQIEQTIYSTDDELIAHLPNDAYLDAVTIKEVPNES